MAIKTCIDGGMWYNRPEFISGFGGEVLDRRNIDKIAQTQEDKVLLAKLWDKINAGINRNIFACTGFLSPREQEMAQFLFGKEPGLCFFGGFENAQRKILAFLPDYLEEFPEDGPIVCLRADFYQGDNLSHRDFLGALMGFGMDRACVGDIYAETGCCHFFVSADVAPHLLRDFQKAGRTALHLTQIPLSAFSPPEEKTEILSDTVPSLRLDCIVSSGFRISRSVADGYICAGKAFIDGLPCEKADKSISQGAVISVRGLGKIRLTEVGNRSKKDRIFIKIEKYL